MLGGGFGLVMHTWNASVVTVISTSLASTLVGLGRPASRGDAIEGEWAEDGRVYRLAVPDTQLI